MSSRRNPESDAAVHFRMLLEMLDTSSLLRGWVRVLGVLNPSLARSETHSVQGKASP
ncbi:hypothetical protein M419DRAFT_8124 [Trichoderma reesei RUT C-30]|uniref:Uncharacterized protein n=1 Tax=Hypocrea jecorina (strain ATCC 56765 / BCRC 32924 / NRRL 11460 / Rut C-30) TaxID=1344414 RepID=A0A024SD99_HYPJR|nr:hypothetical protein M419DRAFT_8124 [Trichoderma reesei RUT C-30]